MTEPPRTKSNLIYRMASRLSGIYINYGHQAIECPGLTTHILSVYKKLSMYHFVQKADDLEHWPLTNDVPNEQPSRRSRAKAYMVKIAQRAYKIRQLKKSAKTFLKRHRYTFAKRPYRGTSPWSEDSSCQDCETLEDLSS